MSIVKERILGALTVMTDEEAKIIWEIIMNRFSDKAWDEIETIEPDELDLAMLDDIDNNTDCHSFISSDELKSILKIDDAS